MPGYSSPAVNKGLSPPCYHENEHLAGHMDCAAERGASVDSRYSMHCRLTLVCVDWSQEGTFRDFRVLSLWNKELDQGLMDSGRNRDLSFRECFQRWMLARELEIVRSPKVLSYQSPDPQWVICIALISSLFEDPGLFPRSFFLHAVLVGRFPRLSVNWLLLYSNVEFLSTLLCCAL